ncbi:hypothetical protein MCOR27_001249 [Pyricularia oryzae]|uniref:Uncharacterized protein n=3 Tax=Pyricularia TaxID=48558 RepID=A0ABQ8NGW0_PYRGI|nr:uncharacterized protein MGG_00964 [Pyricularia oryzae 70-15]KAH8840375.1 hypothetical protein MCOR01_007087 [Pyricularia oryzae]KAI6296852.1 hypothetical protein MCOR33_006655 [Pyricularia grisea]EHA48402.1 hypothetical protein MGG_00964 [Pyricularia oryzae 70-15]KAH9434331.1 hypothetical protein MCOR02_006345 [Pyricularia oryzae]KAI6256983.1 hypothetical protein MCOR19_006565 [Pyricularia oryzae]
MADDLFAINISGDEDDNSPLADQQCPAAKPQSRQDKLRQTEEAFQALKATYSPKIQNGDIQHQISFPLTPASSTTTTVSKMLSQDLVHAVEELYFYRRYAEAAEFAGRVLAQPEVLDADTRTLLTRYQERCRLKTEG